MALSKIRVILNLILFLHWGSVLYAGNLSLVVGSHYNNPIEADATLLDRSVFNAAFKGSLLTLEKSYILKPMLLKNWYWDFEKKEYILELHKGITCHDNAELTSEHIEFGIAKWAFQKNDSILRYHLREILGYDQIKPGSVFKSGLIPGIRIVDKYTIAIKLKEPNPSFMYVLTYPEYSPTHPDWYHSDLVTWKDLPKGCGDFKVFSHDSGKKEIILLRSSHRSTGNIKKLIFRYEDSLNDVDIGFWLTDYYQQKNDWVRLDPYSASIDFGYLATFNFNSGYSKIREFRLALNLAINRKELASKFADQVPMNRVLPSAFWGISEMENIFDPSRAKEIIKKIGHTLPKRPLEIRIPDFNTNIIYRQIAYQLSKDIQAIGVPILIKDRKSDTIWHETFDYDIQVNWIGIGDILDPLAQYGFFIPKSPVRIYDIQDTKFKILFDKAKQAPTFDVRVEQVKVLADYFEFQGFALPLMGKMASIWRGKKRELYLGNQRSSLMFYLDRVRIGGKHAS